MGLLSDGTPLPWSETQKYAAHVREHGIEQFLAIYSKLHSRTGDVLKWGDEVEYMILKVDHVNKRVKLSLRAADILEQLNKIEQNDPQNVRCLWRPEYGAYMIEGTPGKPYGCLMADFNLVERSMRLRREQVSCYLKPDEILMTITNYPRLGCPNFTSPQSTPTPNEGSTRSLFFPDDAVYPSAARFLNLSRNIRQRRGEKVCINVPVFRDVNTKIPFDEGVNLDKNALVDHVYMDAMGFGMGCCCLQLTFQACNIAEARTLYDQLAPICPIMLALTAASPIFRGFLTDVDCRWNVIAGSVDCRTKEERGLEPLKNNKFIIKKSRYDSIDSYLSPIGEPFNDVHLVYDEDIYQKLLRNNIDHLLAQHVAHLFIRDTVSLFQEKIDQDDERDTDHFENIQSTNWQTMRFKPPPTDPKIGWRVEFRPCEVQITDFENAAIVCFIVLLTRAILTFKCQFVIPISKVDENMATAQTRNACTTQKFWFRKRIYDHCKTNHVSDLCELMTIDEIFNGKDVYPGLVPLVRKYISHMEIETNTHCTIEKYLQLIEKRASGKLMTTASWMRKFITESPLYERNSVVSEELNYELIMAIHQIQMGQIKCPQLLGDHNVLSDIPEEPVKRKSC